MLGLHQPPSGEREFRMAGCQKRVSEKPLQSLKWLAVFTVRVGDVETTLLLHLLGAFVVRQRSRINCHQLGERQREAWVHVTPAWFKVLAKRLAPASVPPIFCLNDTGKRSGPRFFSQLQEVRDTQVNRVVLVGLSVRWGHLNSRQFFYQLHWGIIYVLQ